MLLPHPLPRDDSMGNRLHTSIPEDVAYLFIYLFISYTMFCRKWTKQLRNREKKNPNTSSLFEEKGNTVPEVDTIIIVIAINKSSLNADLAFTTTTIHGF